MNTDDLLVGALHRRFARVSVPPCPDGAWRAATAELAPAARPKRLSLKFAYWAALIGVVAIGGLGAQASSTIKQGYDRFMQPFVSSKPLMPLIHRADRLTIAQAQSRIPFPIVVPTGLPAGTRFLYAHVVREHPVPLVALNYQAHLASGYSRIVVDESTAAVGPPVAHFELRMPGQYKKWSLPIRRFKHGAIVMDLFAWGLPDDMSARIVSANKM